MKIFRLFVAVTLIRLALLPAVQAVSPTPDGCYPNFTTAEGCNALSGLTTGQGNTGVGWFALSFAGASNFNTGIGGGALALNTGDSNTAVGAAALLLNTTGTQNTAVGTDALVLNTTGPGNTAYGFDALFSNTTGQFNTANGFGALDHNTIGSSNSATGASALESNTTGNNNTAIGDLALNSCATGSSNIALGFNAATNVVTASNVICIGANLNAADADNTCFIGNIRGVTTINNNAVPVLIDGSGQLGTASSSRRFKTDIKPLDRASESILALKPVSFRYKVHKDATPQFGLIAEEVAEVNPNLVIYDADGKPYTVRYDAVNAMLLNEFLKEHKTVQEQGATMTQQRKEFQAAIAQQQKQIDALTAGLQKVSAQLEVSKAEPQTVLNQAP